jgi:hypothetical protein
LSQHTLPFWARAQSDKPRLWVIRRDRAEGEEIDAKAKPMADKNDLALIREIIDQGGTRYTSGNVDRKRYDRLVSLGWLTSFCPNVSDVVYTVTDSGRAAAKDNSA